MRITPIVKRIEALKLMKSVEGALEFAAAVDQVKAFPSAFVMQLAERAGPNTLVGAVDQRVGERFAVILVLRAITGTGDKVSDQLHDLSLAIKLDLIGWVHPDSQIQTTYAGGRVVGIRDAKLWWQIDFETATHLRKT